MKKHCIDDKPFREVMKLASDNLKSDHFVGEDNGIVCVIVDDAETYFEDQGYASEPYVEPDPKAEV